MKQIQGGVTAAKGFEAAGVEAAIKYQNRKDMALIVSKVPCTVAASMIPEKVWSVLSTGIPVPVW